MFYLGFIYVYLGKSPSVYLCGPVEFQWFNLIWLLWMIEIWEVHLIYITHISNWWDLVSTFDWQQCFMVFHLKCVWTFHLEQDRHCSYIWMYMDGVWWKTLLQWMIMPEILIDMRLIYPHAAVLSGSWIQEPRDRARLLAGAEDLGDPAGVSLGKEGDSQVIFWINSWMMIIYMMPNIFGSTSNYQYDPI